VSNGAHIASIHLSYTEIDLAERRDELYIVYSGDDVTDEDTHYFQQPCAQMTVALAREIMTLQDACACYYENDLEEALDLLNNLESYLEHENIALERDPFWLEMFGEDPLWMEIEMVGKLMENMHANK